MAITVTIGESKTQDIKPFPKLMKHPDGTIMLFGEKSRGVCIVAGGSTPKGHVSYDMVMGMFTDYNEPITLQND